MTGKAQTSTAKAALHKAVREYLVGLVGEKTVSEKLICNISPKLETTLLEVFGGIDRATKYCIYAAAAWVCANSKYLSQPARVGMLVLDDFLCRDYVLKGWDSIDIRQKRLIDAKFSRVEGSVSDAEILTTRYEMEYLSYSFASLLKTGEVNLLPMNPNPYWVFSSRKLGRFPHITCTNHTPLEWREIPVMHGEVYQSLEQAVTAVMSTHGESEPYYRAVCQGLTTARYEWACSTGALIYNPNPLKGDFLNRSGIDVNLLNVPYETFLDYATELKESNRSLPKDERVPNSFLKDKDEALFEWVSNWQGRKIITPVTNFSDYNDIVETTLERSAFGVNMLNQRSITDLDPMLVSFLDA